MRRRRQRSLEEALLDRAEFVDFSAAADLAEERGEEKKALGFRRMAAWAERLHAAFCVAEVSTSRVAGFELEEWGLLVLVTHYRSVSRVNVYAIEGEVGDFGYMSPFMVGKSRGKMNSRIKMGVTVIADAVMWERAKE